MSISNIIKGFAIFGAGLFIGSIIGKKASDYIRDKKDREELEAPVSSYREFNVPEDFKILRKEEALNTKHEPEEQDLSGEEMDEVVEVTKNVCTSGDPDKSEKTPKELRDLEFMDLFKRKLVSTDDTGFITDYDDTIYSITSKEANFNMEYNGMALDIIPKNDGSWKVIDTVSGRTLHEEEVEDCIGDPAFAMEISNAFGYGYIRNARHMIDYRVFVYKVDSDLEDYYKETDEDEDEEDDV